MTRRRGVSRFRAKRLDFSMFQGLFSRSGSSMPDRFQSLAKPNSELHLSLPTPFSIDVVDSPASKPQAYAKGDNGAPKHRKQCGCKQTKCLKLYCECFASGTYCNGCKCVDCHNNIDNESTRHAAVKNMLGRRAKITNSPTLNQESPLVAKQKRHCQCKKTSCLKRYCECFQANMLCSESCKCLDCKNYEGSEENLALPAVRQLNTETFSSKKKRNTETVLRQARIAAYAAMWPFDSNEKNTPTQVNPLTTSGSSSALYVGPPKYRSLLADVISPDSMRLFCSNLVAVSGAGKMRAADSFTSDKHALRENHTVTIRQLEDKENLPCSPDVQELVTDDVVNEDGVSAEFHEPTIVSGMKGMPLSPGADALFCDEKVDLLGRQDHYTNVYMEQERLVLTNFRNFLKKIITCGCMKAGASRDNRREQEGSRILESKTEHPHLKSKMFR